MKKKYLILSLLLCFSLFLVSCSGGDHPAADSQTSALTEPALSSSLEAGKGASSSQPASSSSSRPEAVKIASMKGPTTMGLVHLMNQADQLSQGKEAGEDLLASPADLKTYHFEILSPDVLVPKMAKGEVDMAAVPANAAATLYHKTGGKVEVAAINTLSVLHCLAKNEDIQSVKDLKGKTVYMTGKGTVPELVVDHLLKANGLSRQEVKLEFKSEATEIVGLLKQQDKGVAILPQPFVTVAMQKAEGLKEAFDLGEEWKKANGTDDPIITGVLLVRKDFIDHYPEALSAFLEAYRKSVDKTREVEATAKLVGQYQIVPEKVAAKALPACQITFIEGKAMHSQLEAFLRILGEEEPKSIGGSLPPDDFYYER